MKYLKYTAVCLLFLIPMKGHTQSSFLGLKKSFGLQSSLHVPLTGELRTPNSKVSFENRINMLDFGAHYSFILAQRQVISIRSNFRMLPDISINRLMTESTAETLQTFDDEFLVRLNTASVEMQLSTYNEYAPVGGHFDIRFGVKYAFGAIYPQYTFTEADAVWGASSSVTRIDDPTSFSKLIPFLSAGFGKSMRIKNVCLLDFSFISSFHYGLSRFNYNISPYNGVNIDEELSKGLGSMLNNLFLPSINVSIGFLR